jgi:hyperosmotically inducible protein
MKVTNLLLAVLLAVPAGFAADKAKNHNDAFVNGPNDESQLARKVQHELVMLPYYNIFDDLAFRIDGSTVTLMGEVTNPVLKSDAENVVKRVEGVTAVNNQIEVLPLSPMDQQTRRAVARAIYGDSTLSTRYGFQALPSIHIIVKNGHVRLEGVVANAMDKQIAGMRANSVPNVFSVENDLQVEGK